MKMLEEEYPDLVEIRYTDNPLQLDEKTGQMPEIEKLDDMNWADIVFAANILKYGGPYTARVCGVAKQLGKFFHFDTDDLLTELYEEHHLHGVYKDNKLDDITKFCYANADLVTVTQPKFAVRIQPYVRGGLAVIPNVLDYTLPCWNHPKVNPKFTRVGWAAGIHHREDVKVFSRVPHLVNQKVGAENVKWDFYGHPPPGQKKGNWEDNVWNEYKQSLLKGFKGNKNWQIHYALPPDSYGMYVANMDVAIAPLQMNAFNDSKCWAPGQKLLMYDGTLKNVEDISIGDSLMGVDSTERKVKSIYNGIGNMVKITPKKGKSFIVSDNHILRLKANDKNFKKKKYVEISVKDYMLKNSTFRTNYRLYRTNIDFTDNSKELPLDPYYLGILLGDGSISNGTVAITTMDDEIRDYFSKISKSLDERIVINEDRKKGNKAATFRAVKPYKNVHEKTNIRLILEDIGVYGCKCGDKFIPHVFKVSSRENRLKLLAGLIDTDGYASSLKNTYSYTSKSLKLIDDITFISRSLGFYVCEPSISNINGVDYYTIRLSGEIDCIPCLLSRKKVNKRSCNRDPLTSGFTVEYLGCGECVGIQVDKDGLVVTDDFLVTHNSDIKSAECSRYKIPLIASNVGCYSQTIINGKTGYLIDPDAPTTEWVRILTKVVKDKKHRIELGNNLHEATKDLFDGRKTIKGRYDLYMKAMEATGFKLYAKV